MSMISVLSLLLMQAEVSPPPPPDPVLAVQPSSEKPTPPDQAITLLLPHDPVVLDQLAGGPAKGMWGVSVQAGYPWFSLRTLYGVGHRLAPVFELESALGRRFTTSLGLSLAIAPRSSGNREPKRRGPFAMSGRRGERWGSGFESRKDSEWMSPQTTAGSMRQEAWPFRAYTSVCTSEADDEALAACACGLRK